MTIKYFLAPNGRWSARDLVGDAAVFGFVATYDNLTRNPKATFRDPAGFSHNENPIPLDSKGEANIYWADDNLYTIEVYDVNGFLIYSQDNYPTVSSGGGGAITVIASAPNLIRNPQFSWWTNSITFPGITTAVNRYDFTADDWVFERSNTNATININQEIFTLGQTDVPANPVFYLEYACTNIGSGAETFKRITQYFSSVTTLSNTQVAIAFVAKSSTNSPITVSLIQFFGSGATASTAVETVVKSVTLTNSWTRYTVVATIPSISGKTINGGDDALKIAFNMPLNAIAVVDLCNKQMQASNTVLDFTYQTVDNQFLNIDKLINFSVPQTGDFKFTLNINPPPGWINCDDGTIGNTLSNATYASLQTKALFILIWNNIPNTYAPLSNNNGTPIARGASAEADYDANNQLRMTLTVGLVLANSSGSYPMGLSLGEYNHTLSQAELPPINFVDGYTAVGGTFAFGADWNFTYSAGGGAPHNNIQPTAFVNLMIKL